MDKPIILSMSFPNNIESKAPGVFNFLDIDLAISNSGEITTSIDKFDLEKSHFFGATINKIFNSKKFI